MNIFKFALTCLVVGVVALGSFVPNVAYAHTTPIKTISQNYKGIGVFLPIEICHLSQIKDTIDIAWVNSGTELGFKMFGTAYSVPYKEYYLAITALPRCFVIYDEDHPTIRGVIKTICAPPGWGFDQWGNPDPSVSTCPSH